MGIREITNVSTAAAKFDERRIGNRRAAERSAVPDRSQLLRYLAIGAHCFSNGYGGHHAHEDAGDGIGLRDSEVGERRSEASLPEEKVLGEDRAEEVLGSAPVLQARDALLAQMGFDTEYLGRSPEEIIGDEKIPIEKRKKLLHIMLDYTYLTTDFTLALGSMQYRESVKVQGLKHSINTFSLAMLTGGLRKCPGCTFEVPVKDKARPIRALFDHFKGCLGHQLFRRNSRWFGKAMTEWSDTWSARVPFVKKISIGHPDQVTEEAVQEFEKRVNTKLPRLNKTIVELFEDFDANEKCVCGESFNEHKPDARLPEHLEMVKAFVKSQNEEARKLNPSKEGQDEPAPPFEPNEEYIQAARSALEGEFKRLLSDHYSTCPTWASVMLWWDRCTANWSFDYAKTRTLDEMIEGFESGQTAVHDYLSPDVLQPQPAPKVEAKAEAAPAVDNEAAPAAAA